MIAPWQNLLHQIEQLPEDEQAELAEEMQQMLDDHLAWQHTSERWIEEIEEDKRAGHYQLYGPYSEEEFNAELHRRSKPGALALYYQNLALGESQGETEAPDDANV